MNKMDKINWTKNALIGISLEFLYFNFLRTNDPHPLSVLS